MLNQQADLLCRKHKVACIATENVSKGQDEHKQNYRNSIPFKHLIQKVSDNKHHIFSLSTPCIQHTIYRWLSTLASEGSNRTNHPV